MTPSFTSPDLLNNISAFIKQYWQQCFHASCLILGSLAVSGGVLTTVTPNKQLSEPLPIASAAVSSAVVYISGAVAQPGLYTVPTEARLGEVVESAGGVTEEADLKLLNSQLNLAESISDGQHIYIPPQQTALVAEQLGQPESDYSSSINAVPTSISINTATQSQLESLPGIGEKRAADIIAGRPYTSIDDLVSSGVVTEKILSEIATLISL